MKFCINCGAPLQEGNKFCMNCGQKIEQPAAPAPVQPMPVQPAPVPVQPMPVQPAPAPVQPMPVQPAPAPVQPMPTPVQPDPIPVRPEHVPEKPEKEKKPNNKKRLFLFIGLGVAAILVAVLLFVFLSGDGGSDDPNLGLYNGVSCSYAGIELGAEGEWIELKSGGKLTMMLMGEEYDAKWELDGENITVTDSSGSFYGTLKNGRLTLDLEGLVCVYEKEDATALITPPVTEAKPELPAEVGYWTLKYAEAGGVITMDEETVKMMEDVGYTVYIQLNEDGTGIFNVEEAEKITWGNGKLTADDGSYLNYQLENGELLVDLEGEMLHFVLEAGALNPGNAVVDTGLTPNDLEYWAGDYYGWWVYDNVIVGNSDMNGMWWDCCMSLEIEPDGTGFITIWDEDYGKDDPIGAVDVSVSVYDGVARVVSESGWFMGCEVKHADWLFYSDSTGYDDTLGFFVPYEDSELKIDCYFFMRKWGTIWDDVEAEDMPGYYDSWYLPLIQEGVTAAPDTIG